MEKIDRLPSPSERYKLLNKHPLLCGDFFKRRFNKMVGTKKLKEHYQKKHGGSNLWCICAKDAKLC
jgi:hypothetical protein|tara:strand:- start:499 stop:696 length:198 start_codon:yes stop_codon:yes gene_type:complete